MIRFIIALMLATPAAAQGVIPPEDVLDMVEGRTLQYAAGGQDAGREQFLSRTQVVLRDAFGQCLHGQVTVRGSALCFVYEGDPQQFCWSTFRFPDGSLKMRITSLGNATVLDLARIDDKPVTCDPVGSV